MTPPNPDRPRGLGRGLSALIGDEVAAVKGEPAAKKDIRTLPVVDEDDRLVGAVGLRELTRQGTLDTVMASPATAPPDAPALAMTPVLTDGRSHAVVVTDAERHILGLITQTDLLAAIARLRPAGV